MDLLLLSDGRAGHANQSRAIQMALERAYPVRTTPVNCRLRASFLQRPLQRLLNLTDGRLPIAWFKLFHRADSLPVSLKPDLVISAGGHTCAANAWLAKALGSRNLFCGEIRRLKPELFTGILSAYDRHAENPRYLIAPTPVPIDRRALAEKATAWRARAGVGEAACWSLLVGGDGAGYRYMAEDWRRLGDGLARLAQKNGIRWLVTTSRRTGAEAESALMAGLDTKTVAGTALATRGGGNIGYHEILGVAERHFCTEDSHMMLSEAIASGRPVHSLRPARHDTDASNLYFLQLYERHQWLSRHDIATMAESDYARLPLHPGPEPLDDLAARLKAWWQRVNQHPSPTARPSPPDRATAA
jgi:mitochondrial fission protein ELM1